MGVPIVATSKAAKGTQGTSGKDFLVADDPEFFAREVLRLLKNPGLCDEIAISARQLVERKHGWLASMHILDDVLGGVAPPIGAHNEKGTARYEVGHSE